MSDKAAEWDCVAPGCQLAGQDRANRDVAVASSCVSSYRCGSQWLADMPAWQQPSDSDRDGRGLG